MAKPIKPSEVANRKASTVPDAVFDAFNELIVEEWDGSSATVKQDDVVALIVSKLACERQQVFDRGWLNVEDAFREAGWKVDYDKPGCGERYAAHFTFRKS
jgi:hypothetical protein